MATQKETKSFNLKGQAYWAFVHKPETYDGKELGYSIQVKLKDEEATEKLKNRLEEIFEEEAGELEKTPNRKYPINLAIKELQDGTEVFKARTLHEYKNKQTGELIHKTLPIFNADGTPFPAGTAIGNGSEVQVNVTPKAYCVSGKNYGVRLLLNAVIVKKLVEYQGGGNKSAEDYGFDVDDSVESADEEF